MIATPTALAPIVFSRKTLPFAFGPLSRQPSWALRRMWLAANRLPEGPQPPSETPLPVLSLMAQRRQVPLLAVSRLSPCALRSSVQSSTSQPLLQPICTPVWALSCTCVRRTVKPLEPA